MTVQVLQLPPAEVVPHLEEGVLSVNEEVIAEAARALNNYCQVAEVMACNSSVQLLFIAMHVMCTRHCSQLTALAVPAVLSAALVPAFSCWAGT